LTAAAPPARAREGVEPRRRLGYFFTFAWGVGGVLALLVRALTRLAPMAWQPIAEGLLTAPLVALYAAWVVFNAYCEGYRAFQKAFCPRVIGRAHSLASNPKLWHALLAPLFCLSLFHANRRGLTVAWVMLALITLFVWLLRITPQPWRGIVDGGVVVALAWGAIALTVFAVRALFGRVPDVKLNLPDN
jgi:hypothetical protein